MLVELYHVLSLISTPMSTKKVFIVIFYHYTMMEGRNIDSIFRDVQRELESSSNSRTIYFYILSEYFLYNFNEINEP